MKKADYISKNEFPELLKVGVMVGELQAIAKITQEPKWRKLLNGAANYCNKVMMERLVALKPEMLERTHKKIKDGYVAFCTYTPDRSTTKIQDEKVTINNEDLVMMWMLIDNFVCSRCNQTDVKNCSLRKMLHRTDCPIYTDSPGENECEFHSKIRMNDMNLDIATEVKENV